MRTRIKCHIDTYLIDEPHAIKKAIELANTTPTADKFGQEDVITKIYYISINLGKIFVAVNEKDKTILGKDKVKNAKLFDGNSYIITDQKPHFTREQPFTLSATIVSSCNDGKRGIFGHGNPEQKAHDLSLVQDNKDLIFRVTDSSGDHSAIYITAKNTLTPDKINHCNAVYDPTTSMCTLYVNNEVVGEQKVTTDFNSPTGLPLMIGNCYTSSWDYSKTAFVGEILKCSLHSKALSAKERKSMLQGINIMSDKIVVYDFNSGNPKTQSLGESTIIGKVRNVVSRTGTGLVNIENNILAISDIKDYPLERLPADCIEYIELIIKPEYNLTEEKIANAGQALINEYTEKVFPNKIPILKIIDYGTNVTRSLMLPNILGNGFMCTKQSCIKGNALKGKFVLDEINDFEALHTEVTTGFKIKLGKSVGSNGNAIHELRFYDQLGNEILYNVISKRKYSGINGAWREGNLRDNAKTYSAANSMFLYNGAESANFEVRLKVPAIVAKAYITYGGTSRTPSKVTIIDNNGLVRFTQKESDGNIRKAAREFTFIG